MNYDRQFLLPGEPDPASDATSIDYENEYIADAGYKAFKPKREAFVPTDEDFRQAGRDIGPVGEGYENVAEFLAYLIRHVTLTEHCPHFVQRHVATMIWDSLTGNDPT